MVQTPPESPAISAREIHAARTLAEHLPEGYTAEFVQAPAPNGDNSGVSGTGDSNQDDSHLHPQHLPSPAIGPTSSTVSTHSGNGTTAALHDDDTASASGQLPRDPDNNVSSLHLQGGDVHRSLFRLAEAPVRQQLIDDPESAAASGAENTLSSYNGNNSNNSPLIQPRRKRHHRRAATVHEVEGVGSDAGSVYGSVSGDHYNPYSYGSIAPTTASAATAPNGPPMPVRDLMAPQGFRRDFVLRQRQKDADMERRRNLLRARRASSFGAVANLPITRNFVEFLELYGHFADEDLEEDEEDETEGNEGEGEEEETDEDFDVERGGDDEDEEDEIQRRPLLTRNVSSTSGKKKAGLSQSFFTLLKAFVGTGIMFLPKAYNNGGLVFSTVTLLIVAALSMAGFQLLLQCRSTVLRSVGGGGGYGDIGVAIAGSKMRSLILGSIALSQLGFVCAGLVFVAENLASFALAVEGSTRGVGHGGGGGGGDGSSGHAPSAGVLIGLQMLVLVPLAFVRDIARLGPAALLGDVFIAMGLTYMYAYDVATIRSRGGRLHETVQVWFNPSGYTLTIGAAIFTFEGIGLILPIQSSMAQPEKFGFLLAIVMVIITAAYVSVGALGYAAFGVYTKTEVIDNYPRDSRLVQAVQCLYALAVLAGLPVQLFPAVRIIEGSLFARAVRRGNGSGKRNPRVKWAKNGLRSLMVIACGAVALLGAGSLDRFVALIGSLACVPLLFIYPPYLHFRGVARSWPTKAVDVVLMSVGCVAMVYTTIVTIADGM